MNTYTYKDYFWSLVLQEEINAMVSDGKFSLPENYRYPLLIQSDCIIKQGPWRGGHVFGLLSKAKILGNLIFHDVTLPGSLNLAYTWIEKALVFEKTVVMESIFMQKTHFANFDIRSLRVGGRFTPIPEISEANIYHSTIPSLPHHKDKTRG